MKNLILLLASIAILPQVDGEIPNSISCTPKQCYTTFEIRASFQTAVDMCKKIDGHLMSVRSSASNDAMGELLRDAEGDFWIGLQFNGNGCTDTSRLRRYVWITGDTFTNFTNWSDGDSEPFCAPMCVSVSRDLKWKERSCDKIMDGFLCEHDYTKVCAPLEPRETDESVHYITPFGNEGEGPTMLPMGSVVTGKPSGVRHICTPDGVWLRAPWSCEVLNGGCEHECVTKTPQCTCPAGKALQRNNITCTPNDPCVNLGCEQLCLAGTCLCHDGYELLADGKGCRDKDECRGKMICPNSNCVNTIGSYECLCAAGFVKENGVCVDVDECFSSPCEHECENTKGGYACSCFEGYMPRAGDHTKCELHCDTEVCLATCDINKPTECSCPEGFIKDAPVGEPTVCIDIDECRTNYCSHGCENTLGSYICLCPEGFTLKDGIECDQLSSTPPLITVTPTSNYTKDITSAVTAGGLLGITVCVVLMILIIVFLVHQISRRRSSWNIACMLKSPGEDLQDLQQVTTQKYTKKSSFVNRNVKQDT